MLALIFVPIILGMVVLIDKCEKGYNKWNFI